MCQCVLNLLSSLLFLQRSSSFKESSGSAVKPYRPPGQKNGSGSSGSGVLASYCPPGTRGKSKTKNRRSQLWCETFDRSGLADVELKRQEAIYELYQGERVMVDDLKMAKQVILLFYLVAYFSFYHEKCD